MGIIKTTHLQKALNVILLLFIGVQNTSAECEYRQVLGGEELSMGIMLNWSTSSEKENAMFIIERSEDGIQFANIGAVKGAGHSSKHNDYSFLDNRQTKGQYYYRLRQIDYNGIFETSPTFVFNKYQPTLFSILNISASQSPNQLELNFDSTQDGAFEYELMDWQGKALSTKNIQGKNGLNHLKINLSTFDDLIYQLTLKSAGQEQTIVFRTTQDIKDLSMRE
ncbi:MAG: hypothetical protein ACI8YQ_002288 [Polaribacter sp.]|jgi:hypothetical protein